MEAYKIGWVYAIVRVSAKVLAESPNAYLRYGERTLPVDAGPHFGSRYPTNPTQGAVYDFLPDCILADVSNRCEFVGVLASDSWICNVDARQAIFVRGMQASVSPAEVSNDETGLWLG